MIGMKPETHIEVHAGSRSSAETPGRLNDLDDQLQAASEIRVPNISSYLWISWDFLEINSRFHENISPRVGHSNILYLFFFHFLEIDCLINILYCIYNKISRCVKV
jgi:hypothetical protein